MELSDFFHENKKAAIAFSGGVDSVYLLYAAHSYGAVVTPYYVKSVFQPQFELDDAKRAAQILHMEIKVLKPDIFSDERVAENTAKRCYYCKKILFSTIWEAAERDGYSLLLDGTNASDREEDRPGMRALREFSVRSPLKECGLTKDEIRRRSKEAGLFTWKKPAYACLATRIPSGVRITPELLAKTEAAEDFLFSLGFTDFRIRMMGDAARIQLPQGEMQKAVENRKIIIDGLKTYYSSVLLDLKARDEEYTGG